MVTGISEKDLLRTQPICIYRISPNKLKCIMMQKDGRVEEWMRCQTADGNMVWHSRCTKTGKEVKIYYEKFTCLDGTWRPVSKEGGQKLTQYLGKSLSHLY